MRARVMKVHHVLRLLLDSVTQMMMMAGVVVPTHRSFFFLLYCIGSLSLFVPCCMTTDHVSMVDGVPCGKTRTVPYSVLEPTRLTPVVAMLPSLPCSPGTMMLHTKSREVHRPVSLTLLYAHYQGREA